MQGIIKIEAMPHIGAINIKLSTIFGEVATRYNSVHGLEAIGNVGENTLRHPLAAIETEKHLIELFNAGRKHIEQQKDTVLAVRYKSARRIVNDILGERGFFDFMIE